MMMMMMIIIKRQIKLCSNYVCPHRKQQKLILFAVYHMVLRHTGVYSKLNEKRPVMFGDQAILESSSSVFVSSLARVWSVWQGGQGNPLLQNKSEALAWGTPMMTEYVQAAL